MGYNTNAWTLAAITLSVITGCENAGTDEADYPACIDTRVEITPDEITPLGYSAQSILDEFAGNYVNTVDFFDGTSSEITVDLSHSDGVMYFVDSEPEESDGDLEPAIGVECLDFILIESDLSVSTEDGKLNESALVNLFSYEASVAQTVLVLTPDELQGTLETVSDPAEWDEIRFAISTAFTSAGNTGTITETASVTNEEEGDDVGTASARITDIATWPRAL